MYYYENSKVIEVDESILNFLIGSQNTITKVNNTPVYHYLVIGSELLPSIMC